MTFSDVGYILNFGVGPVIVVFLLMVGVLFPRWYVTKLEKENEVLKDNLAMQKKITEELTQAVANSNQLIGALKNQTGRGKPDDDDYSGERGYPPGRY
ncbi:MAG TPA: hypothetical protein VGR89_10125 [Puia sp.]|nr:hypothetical protein [Puia sp.]